MSLKLSLLCSVLLLSITCTFAQENPADSSSDPKKLPVHRQVVVVTGTYQPVPLEDSERSVEVLELEDRTLYGSWVDGLRLDPSVDLRQRAPGVQADLSIRGSSFGQTLVLVDGLRVNDAQSAHHNLDLPIPLTSMDRIEVLHGSGSTMYGSDAVGGAVNFLTTAPSSTELRLGAGGGNFGTNQQYGSLSVARRRVSEQISFDRDFSSGFMEDRDYRNLALASESRLASPLGTTAILLGLSDRPFGANRFYGNFNSWERTKGWFAGATQDLGDRTQAAFGYRRHTDQFILFRDQPAVYENNHITESYQMALRRHDPLGQFATVFYGIEGYRDTIDSNNLGYHRRNEGALYVDVRVAEAKRLSITTGARLEAYSGDHTEFSPHISLAYRLASRVKLKGSINHAFRLPTFTDLYYQDPANLGNPNLKPERAWGYEGGLLWNANDKVATEVTVFSRRERDGIDYVRTTPTSQWQAANIDRLNFVGVESLTRIQAGRFQSCELGYTGNYGAQESSGALVSKYTRSYPVHQASASWLGTTPGKVLIRARLGLTDRTSQGAYPLAELSVARNIGPLTPYLRFTNLTNTGYEEIEGVRMPGRAVIVGVELRVGSERVKRWPRARRQENHRGL